MDTSDTLAVFDALAAAHKEGGEEAYETLRSEILEHHFTNEVEPHKQLKGRQIQWRIEGIRNKVKDPQERFNRLIAEMWKSVNAQHEALHELQAALVELQLTASGVSLDNPLVDDDISINFEKPDPKIIPFKTKT